jgi:hypothetical protein
MEQIKVVVLSCDKYSDLWPVFIDEFNRFWPNCPFRKLIISNKICLEYKGFSTIPVGDDASWSTNLLSFLNLEISDYYFFIFDDTFLNRKVDDQRTLSTFSFIVKNKIKYLRCVRSQVNFSSREEFIVLSNKSFYRNSLVYSLVNREYLISLLREGESAWDYELRGNHRTVDFIHMCLGSSLFSFDHMIVRGEFLILPWLRFKGKFASQRKVMSLFKSLNYYILKVIFVPLNFLPISVRYVILRKFSKNLKNV